METRANYIIVGIFTLVALVAAFAFIYWTAAIGDRGDRAARAHSGLRLGPGTR
jgi:phospholipid/cholesterol/gamma-HCH transport system substrate-binding protein